MRSGGPKRREERFKLLATLLNNFGVLVVGAGAIGPFFLGTIRPVWAIAAVLGGFGLHLLGLFVLEFDDPEED